MEALRDQFRPEFLNRLDEMVVFNVLSKEAIKDIVSIQLDIVRKRLTEKEITLEHSEIDISSFSKGMYFLRVENHQKILTFEKSIG